MLAQHLPFLPSSVLPLSVACCVLLSSGLSATNNCRVLWASSPERVWFRWVTLGLLYPVFLLGLRVPTFMWKNISFTKQENLLHCDSKSPYRNNTKRQSVNKLRFERHNESYHPDQYFNSGYWQLSMRSTMSDVHPLIVTEASGLLAKSILPLCNWFYRVHLSRTDLSSFSTQINIRSRFLRLKH